jgi:hypothetical protein
MVMADGKLKKERWKCFGAIDLGSSVVLSEDYTCACCGQPAFPDDHAEAYAPLDGKEYEDCEPDNDVWWCPDCFTWNYRILRQGPYYLVAVRERAKCFPPGPAPAGDDEGQPAAVTTATALKRVYVTTTADFAKVIWTQGFPNLHEKSGTLGVYVTGAPVDVNDGVKGDVVLCLDIPEEVFRKYDVSDELQPYGLALVPPEVLNHYGKPKLYDYKWAGMSRRELLAAARRWEKAEKRAERARDHGRKIREAMEFLDSVGWLTPLKLQEQGSEEEEG